ncbi:MAG: LON peptidase substrate-binding domain-containing protein [Hydrogenophaga sp.]|uniref:LON peptidase substrate-binding domain-containing protein n=3 Tax=Hydrogenophaga sp. TaxID=1904254 RepID=UPI002A36AE98|nr:LON peptidase substrate-binding domain-containing protein [Hydrogenophaga sp.]MDX9968495.1 LON peptidase substrate-binding domain-containing protein [Hydrogenophaga sp.]
MSEAAEAAAPLTLSQLPLFPLGTVLFPDGWMPLRIFEVRYLDMINRCIKAGAPFGVVCLTEGSEVRRIDPDAPTGFAREAFHPVGTLARIDQVERPQAGLILIRCRGQQRFHIRSSQQLPHGLWMGDVTLDTPEPRVPVPEHLASARDALRRVLDNLHERDPGTMNDLPLQPPYHWDDSGWVANRWAELLPLPAELKQRLMVLDNPLLRLELVSDLLDRMGVER